MASPHFTSSPVSDWPRKLDSETSAFTFLMVRERSALPSGQVRDTRSALAPVGLMRNCSNSARAPLLCEIFRRSCSRNGALLASTMAVPTPTMTVRTRISPIATWTMRIRR